MTLRENIEANLKATGDHLGRTPQEVSADHALTDLPESALDDADGPIYAAYVDEIPDLTLEAHEICDEVTPATVVAMWLKLKQRCIASESALTAARAQVDELRREIDVRVEFGLALNRDKERFKAQLQEIKQQEHPANAYLRGQALAVHKMVQLFKRGSEADYVFEPYATPTASLKQNEETGA